MAAARDDDDSSDASDNQDVSLTGSVAIENNGDDRSEDSSSSDSESSSQEDAMLDDTDTAADDVSPPSTTQQQSATSAKEAVVAATSRPTLSKSWSIQSSHVPIYTGGKVVVASTAAVSSMVPTISDNDHDDDTTMHDTTASTRIQLLLLPVSGNLCVVDAARGQRLASVRSDDIDNDDDDEDEGVDHEAITAYCCTKSNTTTSSDLRIFTCSRNLVLKQYRLVPPVAASSSNASSSSSSSSGAAAWSIPLEQSLGKSGHTLPVTLMQLHGSDAFLATGSVDGSVRIWDVRSKYCTHVFRPVASLAAHSTADSSSSGARRTVTALQWMPSARQLVVGIGRDDGGITIVNLRDARQEHVVLLTDHVSAVTCLQWTNDLSILVTAGRDAVLNVWSVKEVTTVGKAKNVSAVTRTVYERLHTLPIYEQIEGLALLQTKQTRNQVVVATAGSKGLVRLYKLANDDDDAVIVSNKSNLRLELLAEQPGPEAFNDARGGYLDMSLCTAAAASNSTEQLLVADAENNLSFLSLDDTCLLKTKRTIVGHNDEILDLKVIPNERCSAERIVVATNSSKVSLFDLKDFSCQVLDGHSATVLCVDVSPCGRYVATCGKDRQMLLWCLADNACVGSAAGHTEAIGSVALSRKLAGYDVSGKAAMNGGGSFAVTASVDRTLKRWNLPGSRVLGAVAAEDESHELQAFHSVRAHEKDINIVSIAPNDSLIATGSQDKSIKIWRASDLSLQTTLKGHKRGVWDCQFSSYDRVLASCSGDKTVKLWSLSEPYSCVRTFQGHLASALRVRFLRGGLQFVSSGADGLLKLWTIRTSQCEATMDGHSAKVWAMDLSSAGDVLVSGGGDSKIAVWEDTTKEIEEAENAEKADAVLLDQKLVNHLRHKEYADAFAIALRRDKPHHVLKILTAIIDEDVGKGGIGLDSLKREARQWTDDTLLQILRYCRDWNTRARNSHVAMLVCKAVVTVFPVDKLVKIQGLPELVAGIVPYAERHFDRIDRLHSTTYLLDFVLVSMGGVEAEEDLVNDFATWESNSRLVLPPAASEGRTQVGGTLIGSSKGLSSIATAGVDDSDEQITVGESDSSDDEQ